MPTVSAKRSQQAVADKRKWAANQLSRSFVEDIRKKTPPEYGESALRSPEHVVYMESQQKGEHR